MRGELPSQEQTTCSGNSRCSSVCLLARIEWNNRGQPDTPARRTSRVISVRRFEFFQPIAVLAAARYCGAATTYSLLSPKTREPRNTPNTRKHDITVEGFISVCSVCSVVKKNARIGGYHHRQRLCQPSGLDECQSVWIDLSVLY